MDLSTFHTKDPKAPAAFAWGFIEISGIRSLDANVRCYVGLDRSAEAGVTFRTAAGAWVMINVFRLPAAEKEFVPLAKPHKAEPWPLPGGVAFEPHVLAPRQVPPTWTHSASHSFSKAKPKGGHHIKHVWRGNGLGLVVMYILDQGDPLAEPLFRLVAENLRAVPGAWRLTPPVPEERRDDDELEGPDDVSDGHDPAELYGRSQIADTHHARPGGKSHDRPLEQNEQDELFANILKGWDLLKLPEDASPQEAVKALRQAVEQVRPTVGGLKAHARHNLAVALGSAFGHALCRSAGWEWCALSPPGSDEFLAVVSADRAHALSPVGYLDRQLDPAAENTLALLFNMVRAGNLPPARPAEYRILT